MLKQSNLKTRTLFLKLFIQELLLNSAPHPLSFEAKAELREKLDKGLREKVKPIPVELVSPTKIEKLVLNVVQPAKAPAQAPGKTPGKPSPSTTQTGPGVSESPLNLSQFQPSIMHISEIERGKQIQQTTSKAINIPKSQQIPTPKPQITPTPQPPQKQLSQPTPAQQKQIPKTPTPTQPTPLPTAPPTSTPSTPAPAEAGLRKINAFLSDRTVMRIECQGPNKNLLVSKYGQISLAKISLQQEEIDEIISYFSEKARIPIIEGVFKASVGNLIISAVISEFVGSRFIIDKISPHSLLERHSQQLARAQFHHKK